MYYSYFAGVPPRNPKVSVPLSSPLQQNQSSNSNNQFIVHHGHNGFNGAKPRFLSSSPAAKKMHPNNVVLSPSKMNLSAIHSAVSPGAAITGTCVLTRQTIIFFFINFQCFFLIQLGFSNLQCQKWIIIYCLKRLAKNLSNSR